MAVAISASAMPGATLRERGLVHVGEPAERVHDPPHRAEQADVGADRADRGEERQVRVEIVHLALIRGAHGAARAVHHGGHRQRGLLAQLHELAKAGFEDALHAAGGRRELTIAWNSEFRSEPLQKVRSKSSALRRVLRITKALRKMNHQEASDIASSSPSTSFTTKLALLIKRNQRQILRDVHASSSCVTVLAQACLQRGVHVRRHARRLEPVGGDAGQIDRALHQQFLAAQHALRQRELSAPQIARSRR